ncbi:antibiotic biosynthesis monooxygenase [Arthrobacter sp. I2-34]|uniref:Antibiotic biosynthesis monooxygenase n=1 Tax=Arthrobacter hankyongi TaxID=2904801 RepID=A0ABS9L6A1_9MICC|nr:antibiotic biosynthesis monooxygenase family protein [Arthrobacter hankyongi]MCG2622194.1 antibiotic biosynthesis monooxygenase [Arthrobacter hankyongi]
MSVYSLGIWLVKPGREGDFERAWQELARRTEEEFPGRKAVLMHDRDVHNRFISTGPWESVEQIEQWRASEAFTGSLEPIKDLIERFEPHTLDEAVVIGGGFAG